MTDAIGGRRASGSAAGDHRLTLLADWDGERADLIDQLAAANVPASKAGSVTHFEGETLVV